MDRKEKRRYIAWALRVLQTVVELLIYKKIGPK